VLKVNCVVPLIDFAAGLFNALLCCMFQGTQNMRWHAGQALSQSSHSYRNSTMPWLEDNVGMNTANARPVRNVAIMQIRWCNCLATGISTVASGQWTSKVQLPSNGHFYSCDWTVD
jgi:hypothetical protein